MVRSFDSGLEEPLNITPDRRLWDHCHSRTTIIIVNFARFARFAPSPVAVGSHGGRFSPAQLGTVASGQ